LIYLKSILISHRKVRIPFDFSPVQWKSYFHRNSK